MASAGDPADQYSVIITLHEDGTASIVGLDREEKVSAADPDEALKEGLTVVTRWAQESGSQFDVAVREANDEWPLVVRPDGVIVLVDQGTEESSELAPANPSGIVGPAPTAQETERGPRESFLTRRPEQVKATRGLRGLFGMAPGSEEMFDRDCVQAISQRWPDAKTIAVVGGKGGSSKTLTTALLSAVFARLGGAGVLAWDNNQTQGTLGWRTDQAAHQATVLDLLPEAEHFLQPDAQVAALSLFVHDQGEDRFDVLRSKPLELAGRRITPADVDAIQAVASKYYRLVFIDSGTDESDPIWLSMVDNADQLVVATTAQADHAEAAALLLEALEGRDPRSAGLARNAVVVVNQTDTHAGKRSLERISGGFRDLGHTTVVIPFDEALVQGPLQFGSLRPATRRAWLAAAAALAKKL